MQHVLNMLNVLCYSYSISDFILFIDYWLYYYFRVWISCQWTTHWHEIHTRLPSQNRSKLLTNQNTNTCPNNKTPLTTLCSSAFCLGPLGLSIASCGLPKTTLNRMRPTSCTFTRWFIIWLRVEERNSFSQSVAKCRV